jgi:hypothetical protein
LLLLLQNNWWTQCVRPSIHEGFKVPFLDAFRIVQKVNLKKRKQAAVICFTARPHHAHLPLELVTSIIVFTPIVINDKTVSMLVVRLDSAAYEVLLLLLLLLLLFPLLI